MLVPQPIGVPPTYAAPLGLPAVPIYYCSAPNQCEWIKTSAILDGPNKDFEGFGFSTFPGGMKLSKPHPVNRLYLVNENGTDHQPFNLNNRVLSFDVNHSQVRCGYNAAFYFSEMPFVSRLGTNYCDAQGICNEFDVFEGNIAAVSEASHSCSGEVGNCDRWGCSINSRRQPKLGMKPYGGGIDFTKPYRIVTTFKTDDGTDNGVLSAIEQMYVQNGRKVSYPTITNDYCTALGPANPQFPTTGRLEAMSQAFKNGMTMIFSLWGDGYESIDMSWLDGGLSNPDCSVAPRGDNTVTFSNIMISFITK